MDGKTSTVTCEQDQ